MLKEKYYFEKGKIFFLSTSRRMKKGKFRVFRMASGLLFFQLKKQAEKPAEKKPFLTCQAPARQRIPRFGQGGEEAYQPTKSLRQTASGSPSPA